MRLRFSKRSTFTLLLFLFALGGTLASGPATGAESRTVTETWFFGSSATDTGNLQAAVPIVPEPTYFHARSSNGPVWAESLAHALGTSAVPSTLGGTNYAFAGARTQDANLGFVPPITAQVADYLLEVGLAADPKALYALETATQDLAAAELESAEAARRIMLDAVAATKSMLIDLFDAGARRFLLLSVPEIPTAPTPVAPDGTDLAVLTNDGFREVADELEAMGATVWLVDLHSLVDRVVGDPNTFGFEITRCSFLGKSSLDVFAGDLVPEPCAPTVPVDDYIMFDDEHFTASMHRLVAREALAEMCGDRRTSPLSPCMDASQTSSPGELPFELTADGQLTVIPPFQAGSDPRCNANLTPEGDHPGAFVTVLDIGTGQGTLLGHFSFEATSCLDPLTGNAPGWGTLKSADGAELYIEFINDPAPAPAGRTGFAGPQTVVGGTGRFEGASGEQHCRGLTDDTDLSVEFQCAGSLAIEPGTAGS